MSAAHEFTARVYYQDTDAGGIMYHANYLCFAERARAEALRALGLPHAALVALHGVMLVVRTIKLDYQRPARLDDLVTVATRIVAVGGASVTLRQDFRRDSDSLAVLEVYLGCARIATGSAARLPESWRNGMAAALD